MKPLIVPPAAQRDQDAVQMLGAWIAEKGLHCSLNIGMWQDSGQDEPAAWGILIADTIRHVANALHERYGLASDDVVSAILGSLDAELGEPTSDTEGSFEHGHH
jgi:hypothetical protein